MKYLISLLVFLPFTILACSNNSDFNELTPYASIVNPAKVPQEIEAIGIYVPTKIEKANVAYINVQYLNDETLLLSTSINIAEAEDYEIKATPDIKGYSIGYFYLNMSQVENIYITVNYEYPLTKDGGVTMCGPTRSFKLADIMKTKT